MPIYHINTEVKSTSGFQTWKIEAESPEQALKLYYSGKGDIAIEEIEVTSSSDPDLSDVEELEQTGLPDFTFNPEDKGSHKGSFDDILECDNASSTTGSQKLPRRCSHCYIAELDAPKLGFKYCPFCGRQLRAGA